MAERDNALDGLGLDDEEAKGEEDLAVLKRVWRNEKCAPVLLPYEEVRAIPNLSHLFHLSHFPHPSCCRCCPVRKTGNRLSIKGNGWDAQSACMQARMQSPGLEPCGGANRSDGRAERPNLAHLPLPAALLACARRTLRETSTEIVGTGAGASDGRGALKRMRPPAGTRGARARICHGSGRVPG